MLKERFDLIIEQGLQFIEKVYNQRRLHPALGYRPSAEFERALSAAAGGEVRG